MRVASAARSFGGEGFGGEGGVVGRRGEGEVHLRGAAAEQGGGVKGKARVLAGFAGMDAWPGSSRKLGGDPVSMGSGAGDDVFVVAGKFVEGELPAVALVFDEALEHGEGGLFGGGVRSPSRLPRISPRNGAMRGKWATSVRKRPISVSGFSPGWRRRKSLRMSFWS